MNKTFKVVFSKVRGGMVVASEVAATSRKKGVKTVIAAAVSALAMGAAMAAPVENEEISPVYNAGAYLGSEYYNNTDPDKISIEATDEGYVIKADGFGAGAQEGSVPVYGAAVNNSTNSYVNGRDEIHILNGSAFTGNKAQYGAALVIFQEGGEELLNHANTVTGTTFSGNEVTGQGGAVALFQNGYDAPADGSTTFDTVVVERNKAVGNGGAIYAEGTEVRTQGASRFEENESGQDGGAIYGNRYTTINVGAGSEFVGNSADRNGGAIYSHAGVIAVDGADFTGNSAGKNGGAIAAFTDNHLSGEYSIVNSTFSKNTATAKGGALAWLQMETQQRSEVSLNVVNSTFTENSAGTGGAIAVEEEIVISGNSSFSENSSTSNGGAVWVNPAIEGSHLIVADGTESEHVVFANNHSGDQGGAIYNGSVTEIGDYTVFEGNTALIGGAISTNTNGSVNPNASMTIGNNVSFIGNEAEHQGGAIFAQKSDLVIGDDVQFVKNHSSEFTGGAIYIDTDQGVESTTVIGDRAVFDGNTSDTGAGAIYIYANQETAETTATLRIGDDASFSNNSTTGNAGAVASFAATVEVGDRAVFTNNHADGNGGAIVSRMDSTMTLGDGAVFEGNSANGSGGAIFNDGTLNVSSATFSGNTAAGELNDIHNDGTLSVTGDLVLDGGISGTGTTKFGSESSLTVKLGTTTISNTVNADDGAQLRFVINPGFTGNYNVFTEDSTAAESFTLDTDNTVFNISRNEDGTFTVEQKSAGEISQSTGADANQAAALNAIMASGAGSNDMFNSISEFVSANIQSSDAGSRRSALDAVTALSPEAAPLIAQTQTDTANQIFTAVGSRFALSNTQQPGSNLWVQLLANTGDYDGSGSVHGYDTDSYGVAFGLDSAVSDSVRVGVGFAYTDTDVDGFMRDIDVGTATAFLYGQYKPSEWFINGIVSYGWSSYDESKRVAGFNVGADYDVDTFGMQVMTGYDMTFGDVSLTPEGGLRYYYISQDGYRDDAGSSVDSEDNDVLTAVIGAKLSRAWEVSPAVTLKPQVRVAATYDLIDADNDAVVTPANGSTYRVSGETLDRFGFEVDAGISAAVSENFEFALTYAGNFRGDFTNHAGLINMKYKF